MHAWRQARKRAQAGDAGSHPSLQCTSTDVSSSITARATLSAPASIDIATLFASRTVAAAVEVTLPGAMPLADVQRTTFRTEGGLVVTLPDPPPPPSGANLTVTIFPMQIRAFALTMV